MAKKEENAMELKLKREISVLQAVTGKYRGGKQSSKMKAWIAGVDAKIAKLEAQIAEITKG